MTFYKIIFLFTICSFTLYSQKSDFYFHINAEKGLPTTVIYNLHIDKYGRLLLGTEKGLYRYNGVRYTRFICSSAINKDITDIVSNKNGRIMMHNFSGQLFELINDSLIEIHLPKQPAEIQNIKLYDQLLYLFSPKKTFKYRLSDFKLIDSFSIEDRKTDISDALINNEGKEIINLVDSTVLFKKNEIVNHISTKKSKHIILIGNQLYLTPYRGNQQLQIIENGKITQSINLPFKNNPLTINANLINNLLYISSQNGICEYDPKSNTSRILFDGEKITDIKKDFEGNIWISTLGNGIFMIPLNGLKKYSSIAHTSICDGPDSTFFCGTSKGVVHQFNSNGKLIKTFEPFNNLIESSFIWFNNKTNRIYTNTSVFDISKGLISNRSFQTVDYCKNIIKDSDNNYWIAKPYALLFVQKNPEFDNKNIVYELGKTKESKEIQIRNVRSRYVYYFPYNKKTYSAFVDGLFEIDKNLNVKEIKNSEQKSYNPRYITSVKNHLYLGTLDKGIYVLNNNNSEIKHLTKLNGLSSNAILKIINLKDDLFILTDEGIDKLNLNTNNIKRLNSVFGLNSVNIRDINIVNNHLFIASDEGIIELGNENVKKHNPIILIKGLYNDGKLTDEKMLPEIPFEKRNISIRFEPITYSAFGNFVIQYKLNSNESTMYNWNSLSSFSDELNLPNLPPGNYSFLTRIYIPQFETYSDISRLHFSINQPWYKSIWAITIIVMTLLILIVTSIAIRSKIANKKQIEELHKETLRKELAESKLTALKARMNPHFIYNVLNSIQGLIYTNKFNEANHYMVKYADLTRKYLEQSAKDNISLKEEIDTLSDYLELEKLRFEETFNYNITFDSILDINNTFIPPLLIQPFVENSVKHGLLHKNGDKKITVNFKVDSLDLHIYIEDNGIGLKKSAEINARRQNKPKSFATSAIHQKISLINKYRLKPINFTVSEIEQGTRVIISIPGII